MMIKTSRTRARFSRRAFLSYLGASGVMLPLLEAEPALGASPAAYPKRIITIAWTNGICRSAFYPTDDNPTSQPVLKPLAPFQAKTILAAGLDYQVMLEGNHRYDGHFSYPVMYTGAYKNTGGQGSTSAGPSIDQVISDNIAKTVNLPMPLINISIGGSSTSYRGTDQRNTGEGNPQRLFDKLFSSKIMPVSAVNQLRDRRKSVLDFLGSDLQSFGNRMGTDDKAKIAAHLDSIRQLETQLSAVSTVACTAPTFSVQNLAYQDAVKAMSDLTAIAFKCDMSRVASLVWGDDGGSSPGSFPFLGVNGDYHGIAHKGTDGYSDKIKIDTWYYSQVANIAKQLDSTVEGSGTALDNTVIVVGTDMNEGSGHDVGGLSFVLIGGCGGAFRTGRTVRLGKWNGRSGDYWNGDSGVPHNKLLTSLGNAMDLSINSFGSSNYSGSLTELQ